MNILVTDDIDKYIVFTSEYGNGIAYTRQDAFTAGERHGVEFDIEVGLSVTIDSNTSIGSLHKPGFYQDGDYTLVVAYVENIDDDNEICLRIGESCIILAYAEGIGIQVGNLVEIRLHKDQLLITSIGKEYPYSRT